MPSTTRHDEFNTLVVTRHHPVNAVYLEACVAEIQPKLNLVILGVRSVAVLKQGKEEYNLAYGDRSTLGKIGECFGLYHKKRDEQGRCDEIALAFLYCDEGWRTLEEMADKRGIIWAKRPEQELFPDGAISTDFKDPRYTSGKMAYLDFQQRWPQFISKARDAHQIVDILAAAFFAVMTVQSRKERMIKELGALPGYTP